MTPDVVIERVRLGNDHDDSKWVVLQGSVPGVPQVTKRRSINSAALVAGQTTLAAEKEKLVSDVLEYFARHIAVQEALKEL